jgi:hypothetical protein
MPLAVLLAFLGFSVAIATPLNDPANRLSSKTAKSRGVGEAIRFTNPFLAAGTDPLYFPTGGDAKSDPDGFDLGDAIASMPLVRYINATGGFLPYAFAAQPLVDPRNAINGKVFQPPQLLPFGKLKLNLLDLPNPSGASAAMRFDVVLQDMVSTNRVGRFWMNIINSANATFRFGMDKLPVAQQGRTYFTNIQAIGGTGTITYRALGTDGDRLKDMGLVLSADGALYGRPIRSGTLQFTVQAQDQTSPTPQFARSRNGQSFDQFFTLTIESSIPISTELTATACEVRGALVPPTGTAPGTDTFRYSGILDPKGNKAASLAGADVTVRVGTSAFSGQFDSKGKADLKNGTPDQATDTAPVVGKASFSSSSGQFTVQLKGVFLGDAVGAAIDPATNLAKFGTGPSVQTLVLALEFACTGFHEAETRAGFRTCEVLAVQTHVHVEKFSMSYALGSRGFSRAGACQIVSVTGADQTAKDKTQGTKWIVRCLGMPGQDTAGTPTSSHPHVPAPTFAPPKAPATILAATSTTIVIGDFSNQVTLAMLKVRPGFKGTSSDTFAKVLLDPKRFVHYIETNVFAPADTSIERAIDSKQPTIFPFALSFTGFTGEAGRVIVPDRGRWTQQP